MPSAFLSSSHALGMLRLASSSRAQPIRAPTLRAPSATALLTASLLLVREARLAVTATLHEMSYVRRIVARKTGRPLG